MTSVFSWQNSVLVSTAQQSEGATHLCMSLPLWTSFALRLPRALPGVRCAIHHVLLSYLVYHIVVQLLSHV